MASVVLRSHGFEEFTIDPGLIAAGGTYSQQYRDFELDGTDLPTGIVVDWIFVSLRGRHTNPSGGGPAHPQSVQRRWVNAPGYTDDESADWPESTTVGNGFSVPGSSSYTGHDTPLLFSQEYDLSPGVGTPWTRDAVLAATYGFDLGWDNDTAIALWPYGATVHDFYVTVEYHLTEDPPPPDPEPDPDEVPPLPSTPCCTSECCEHDPSGPGAEGPTNPPNPDTYERFPQCAGGGDLPVHEAVVDSEVYF